MRKLAKFKARELHENPCHIRDPEPEAERRALGMSVIRHQELPLIVRPEKVIFDGHRRRAGVMLIDPDFELECLVTDEEIDAREIQLITDMKKKLRPYEKFKLMEGWMTEHAGDTAARLAERLGMTPGNVSMTLSLTKCIPAWHSAAEAGRVSVSDWYEASRLDDKGQHELLAMKMTTGASREVLKSASRKKRNGTPLVRMQKVKIALPAGAVVLTGNELGMAEVVEMLAEVLKEAKKAADTFDVKTWVKMMADKSKGG